MKSGAVSLVLGLFLSGWLYANHENRESLLFSPEFSDPAFSCRCLPMFDAPIYKSTESISAAFQLHRKICEYKTYIRGLERHVNLYKELLDGDGQCYAQMFVEFGKKAEDEKICDWFCKKGLEVASSAETVKTGMLKMFEQLPFDTIIQQLRTESFKSVVRSIQEKKSFDGLFNYWAALQKFADDANDDCFQVAFAQELIVTKSLPKGLIAQQEITQAYLLLKDFVDFMAELHGFIDVVVMSELSKNSGMLKHDRQVVREMIIVDVLAVVNRLMQLSGAKIEAQYKKENLDIYRWIKEKWTMISLSVGVILIDVTYTFPVQTNMLQGEKRNIYDMNSIQVLL